MKRARLLGLLLVGVVGVVAACGDEEDPIVDPAVDAGPEGSLVDTTQPAVDTGVVVDTGIPIADSGFEGGTTLDGGACGGDAVVVASVVPQFAWVAGKTALTITGTGFIATPKVYLRATGGVDAGASDSGADAGTPGGFVQVQHVAFVSSTSLTVVLPANFVGTGTYELAVVNPNSCAGVIAGGLRIVGNPPPRIDTASPSAGTTQENVISTIKGCYFPTGVGGLKLDAVSSAGVVTAMSTQGTATCGGPVRTDCNNTNECTLEGVIGTKTPGLTSGAYLLRITNLADNTFGEYATFVVTNPSGNLTGGFVAEDALTTGRRSLGLVSGRVNDASRFLYAIGGENAAGTALKTIEVGPLDRFGQLGKWFENKNQMELARSGPAVARHGKWIYVVGGTSSTGGTGGASPTGTPLESFERAKILDPANAPIVADPPGTATVGTLAKGTWYYKVSAINSDTDDPTGESIASDEVVATLSAAGNVKLSWQSMTGVTGWKIYRSPAADGTSDSEVLLATITGGDASTTTHYVDDGSATPGTEKPMAAGSTGKWIKTDTALGPRLNAAAVVALDPANSANASIYVSGGWGNCTAGQTTYNVMNCVHTATINGTTGALGAFGNFAILTNGRMRHGMEVMTKANGPAAYTDAGAASTATFLFVAGGRNAAGTFGATTNIEHVLVANGGGSSNASFSAVVDGFGDARDALQFRIANGYGYAFHGGSIQGGNNVNYSVSTTQGLATVGATTVTFPNWSNAAANLGGNEKVGRHGVVDESAYFYLVGGTTNDTDARSTVYRVLH